jgi:Tfp pilus tip-associated adhesin PilY1
MAKGQKTTTQTEVQDRLLGGKKVKQTEVTEQGDKTQVKETKTELNPDGTLKKRVTIVKGDDIK